MTCLIHKVVESGATLLMNPSYRSDDLKPVAIVQDESSHNELAIEARRQLGRLCTYRDNIDYEKAWSGRTLSHKTYQNTSDGVTLEDIFRRVLAFVVHGKGKRFWA